MTSAAPTPRPVVLVLTAHYLPGFKAGGPIRTIHNLTEGLGDRFDFRVFTSDRDYGMAHPFPGVGINEWTVLDKARVFYADASSRRPSRMARIIADVSPDIVYVNSFFSPAFSIQPLTLRRLGWAAHGAAWIVAPRGEFSPGALAIKSFKKRCFMAAARALGLHRGITWQASSGHEAGDIERAVGTPASDVRIAPNLTAPVSPEPPEVPSSVDPARISVCFLARVCPMKNLAFAIEALRSCSVGVDLHVYGPVEDQAYAEKCRRAVPGQGSRLAVSWHGEIAHDLVRDTIAAHDAYVLPTLGENFGHGIFEALAAGVPVLVSDRTPWRELDAAGVGWVRSLDDQRLFAEAIDQLASMTPDARLAMRRRAHAYAAKVALSSEAREANINMFQEALARRVS